jgi:hypothetical protein
MKTILGLIISVVLINFIHSQPLKIKKPLLEGNQVVEIYFQKGVIDKLRVEVSSGEIMEYDNLINNQLKATLDKPLVAGEEVVVKGFDTDGGMVTSTGFIVVESNTLEWGFMRSFFNFGSILSKKNNEFSKADLYLDFEMDTHWSRHFVGYVKAQLTSLPKIEDGEVKEANDQQDGINQFIESRKGATIQAGIFFPDILPIKFLKRSWNYHGYKNKLFAAPIIKAGFHTYAENIEQGENEEKSSNSQDNFFTFFTFGLRFGHLRILNPLKTAPKMESYFDVTVGWSDNIGAIRDPEENKPYDRFNNTFNVYLCPFGKCAYG